MNSDDFSYPRIEIVKYWIEILRNQNIQLKLKLPKDSDDWYDYINGIIERSKYIPCDNVFEKAARLFYNINKGHNFVDGNKRSCIVITYLFLLMNNKWITSPDRIGRLAVKVARSKGSKNIDSWIAKIKQELTYISIDVPPVP